MSHQSPQPSSSAFQWPKPANTDNSMNDLSVKEILDRYHDDPELMKYILSAKSEEDKRKAAKDTLKAEEARIQLRQMDLDFAREQTKASSRYDRHGPVPPMHHISAYSVHHPPATAILPPPPPPQPHTAHPHSQHHPHPSHPHHQPPFGAGPGAYYGLAPVQQQVLARFNYPPNYNGHPPASPSVPYPHSAHPLCPPSSSYNNATEERAIRLQQQIRHQQQQQISPTSPPAATQPVNGDESISHNKKRNRSISSSPNNDQLSITINEQQQQQLPQDRISHNKVMEALKAKIQRSNNGQGPPSPLTASPIRSLSMSMQLDSNSSSHKKRKPTLPRPVVIQEAVITASASPSPRSAKPILPPIDTNLGRIDATNHTVGSNSTISSGSISSTGVDHHAGGEQQPKPKMENDSAISSSSSSSSSSGGNISRHHSKKEEQSNKAPVPQQTVTSPSDHILLNTRRARSLSPSSSPSLLVKKA